MKNRRAAELTALAEAERIPGDAIERADAALGDDDPEVRCAAIELIGRLAAFREVPIPDALAARILEHRSDADHRVRAETAASLAMLPRAPEGAARAIRSLLEDAHSRVRQEACAALGDLDDRVSRDLLAERLEDVDPEVRFEAAFALASLKDARARPLLESTLSVTRRRLDACEGLRRLGDPAAADALEKLAGKLFLAWVDRLTAWATLSALGSVEAGAKVVQRAGARSREERIYALSLIGSHRIAAGRELLETIAKNERDPARDTAVRALGDLGDPAALETLDVLRHGPDRALAADAERAIEKIKSH